MNRRRAIGALGTLGCSALLSSKAKAADQGTGAAGGSRSIATITARSAGPVTLGIAALPGLASGGLTLGTLTTQTDVKARWPDRSIKHALISAVIPKPGSYVVSASARADGTFIPVWPVASVDLIVSGVKFTASLPPFVDGGDQWLNGPVVREARTIVTPRTADGISHPFLSVIYDVRSFNAGGHRFDVTVGTTKDVPETNRITYDVSIFLAGRNVFARQNTEHGSFMRWRKVFAAGLTEATVVRDLAALQQLKAIPVYSDIAAKAYAFPIGKNNGGLGYDILQTGVMSPNFGDTGGRPEIGPYPEWQAIYLSTKSDNALDQTLRQADLSGSWSMHLTGPDGNPTELLSIDRKPRYSLLSPLPDGPANGSAGSGMSRVGQNADCAHQASLAYLPYLLTGDRFYADQMAFWANWCLLKQPSVDAPDARNGSGGYLRNDQVRGIAWALRNMTDAATWLYDSHPFKSYFAAKSEANLRWLDETLREPWETHGPHPLGLPIRLVQGNSDGLTPQIAKAATGAEDVTQFVIFAPWQYSYLCWSILHAQHQGLHGGLEMLDALLAIWRDLFTSAPDWPRSHAAPFFPPVAYRRSSGALTLFTTWKECHQASAAWRGDRQDGSSSGCPPFTDGGYGREARLALLMARGRGLRDADGALAYLMAYTNPATRSSMTDYVKGQFGLDARSLSP